MPISAPPASKWSKYICSCCVGGSRAYAAATIVDRISHDHPLRNRYADLARGLESKLLPRSDNLSLYINIMFGLSAMREPNFQRAETCLEEATKAAARVDSGRRYEEAMHSLGARAA